MATRIEIERAKRAAKENGQRYPGWIDDLLESGHRCPQCGYTEFETLQIYEAGEVRWTGEPKGWDTTQAQGHEATLEWGTIKVWCGRCGFTLWSIVLELEAARLALQQNKGLCPADGEGRTTWKPEAGE
jgi:hypothetical protein